MGRVLQFWFLFLVSTCPEQYVWYNLLALGRLAQLARAQL
jgi:hypothetical protein